MFLRPFRMLFNLDLCYISCRLELKVCWFGANILIAWHTWSSFYGFAEFSCLKNGNTWMHMKMVVCILWCWVYKSGTPSHIHTKYLSMSSVHQFVMSECAWKSVFFQTNFNLYVYFPFSTFSLKFDTFVPLADFLHVWTA